MFLPHTEANKLGRSLSFLGILCLILSAGRLVIADGSGIINSAHDFSNQGKSANNWNASGELCGACHVPHDYGRDLYQEGLLWNHATSEATYETYVSFNDVKSSQPSGTSKLCLGCHDGTTAIDDYGGVISGGTAFINDYGSNSQVPGRLTQMNNLGRTHPVGVDYVYDPTDPDGLHNPASPLGSSGTINDVLDNGKVVCASCHDVHNNESISGAKLLRESMKASQGVASGLCLACHKK